MLGNGQISVDLTVSGDLSISRNHAKLIVEAANEKESNKFVVKVVDVGSKYGTFIDEGKGYRKIESNTVYKVEVGSTMKFGLNSGFRIVSHPFCVATSSISLDTKASLEENLGLVGGYLTSEWTSSCTCLVMTEIKLTIKVLQCLIDAKSIVTPEYFKKLVAQARQDPSLPVLDLLQYQPKCAELSLVNTAVTFSPDPSRKNIFDGKIFYFHSDKQYRRLGSIIKAAGGLCARIREDTVDKLKLPETIILAHEGSSSTQRVTQSFSLDPNTSLLYAELNRLGRRPIPETDIPLAVAWASTKQYCNPSFHLKKLVIEGVATPKREAQSVEASEILVAATQTPTSSARQSRERLQSGNKTETQFVGPTGTSPVDPEADRQLSTQDDPARMDTQVITELTLDSSTTGGNPAAKRRLSSSSEPSPKRSHVQDATIVCDARIADRVDSTPVRRGAKRIAVEIKTERISDSGDDDLFEESAPTKRQTTSVETAPQLKDDVEVLPTTSPVRDTGRAETDVGSDVEILQGFLSKVELREKTRGMKKEVVENHNETTVIEVAPLIRQRAFRPQIRVIIGAEKPLKNYKHFQKQQLRRGSQRLSIPMTDSSQSQPFDQARERQEAEEGVAEEPVTVDASIRGLMAPKKPQNSSPFVFTNRRDTQSARATGGVFGLKRADATTLGTTIVQSAAIDKPQITPAAGASKGAKLFAFRNDRRNR